MELVFFTILKASNPTSLLTCSRKTSHRSRDYQTSTLKLLELLSILRLLYTLNTSTLSSRLWPTYTPISLSIYVITVKLLQNEHYIYQDEFLSNKNLSALAPLLASSKVATPIFQTPKPLSPLFQ